MKEKLKIRGYYKVRLLDKDGNLLREATVPNGITNVGKDSILGVMFDAEAQAVSWYIGLIDTVGYSGLSSGDTMASHAGWSEFVGYVEATRAQWNPDTPDGQSIINPTSAYAALTMIGDQLLKGIFLVSENTKGGAAGILWSTALFQDSNVGDDWNVLDGQIIEIQYGVSVT